MANSEQNWFVRHNSSSPSTPLSARGHLQSLPSPLSPFSLPQSPSLQVSPVGSPVFSLAPPPSGEQSKEIERETDQLFRVNTVEKIKSIEKDKRLEIDRRKEDLRQMVGERYRDLIDAADSIMHMKKCSEQAKKSVTVMEQLCQRLQQTHFLRGSGGLRGPVSRTDDQAVAAQVKLLADAPEKIWICLESQNYLPAAHTYLLARHIFSQLSIKLGKGSDKNFTVVQRLWHSVASFKDNIIECSNNHLQCLDLQEDHMLQSLCAIVLLEGCSPRQVFTQALLARKTSVQSVFTATSQHLSVKSQVCQLVKTIVQSLTQISTIFCVRRGDGQLGASVLVQRLSQLTNKDKKQCLKDVIPAKLADRLPDYITGFTPVISATSLTEIPTKDIHSSTKDWITMCVSDVCNGMDSVLQHITTFKALAGIREAVHSLLSQKPSELGQKDQQKPQDDLSSVEAREEWSAICANVLGSDLCVWETFLRPLLLQRAKAIVDQQFAKVGTTASKLLDALLLGAAEESNGGLWEEDQGSFSGEDINPLSLKANACSPSVFSFCQSFDKGLKIFIDDIVHFLGKDECKSQTVEGYWVQQRSGRVPSYPFSLSGDSSELQSYLQGASVECMGRFLKNVGSKVAEIQQEIAVNKETHDLSGLVKRLVLMGRLCHCLMDCSPNFSFLACGCKDQGTSNTRYIPKSHKKSRKEDDRRQTTAEILHDKAISIFRIWSLWCSSEIISQLQDQFSAEMELNSLASTLAWDEIKISEESESGEKVASMIKVPSHCSVYVTSLLFALCQEISRVGGHALDRSLLEELSGRVFLGVLDCYENLLQSSKIPQSCALQLLFNLKFFSSVLAHQPTNEGSGKIDTEARLKKLVDCLQGFVDPFDLDVFMPYIVANLERQLTRSSVLLGVLLAVKCSPNTSSVYKKPSTSSGQEQHIIIPLASSISRLPTLPMTLSSQTTVHAVQDVNADTEFSSLLQTITFFHHL